MPTSDYLRVLRRLNWLWLDGRVLTRIAFCDTIISVRESDIRLCEQAIWSGTQVAEEDGLLNR